MRSNETTRDPGHKALTHQRAGQSGGSILEPVHNERGVIAENYYDLQGLGVLDAARQSYPLPKATGASTLRAVFQSVEIALVNLNDLMLRTTADLEVGAIGSATVKMFWARGFHRVLSRLSLIPLQLGLMCEESSSKGTLRIEDSPAFADYLETLLRFDYVMRQRMESGELQINRAIGEQSLESAEFNLFHLTRVCNHESTIWERNLAEVQVPAFIPSYEEFVVTRGMRDAVYDRVLKGDTYFTQFRGLHQIPETLGEEINDRFEKSILVIRSGNLQEAVGHLNCINVLLEGVIAPLPPMADNLATSDYHQIRENLGLTSGSHSVCLRFNMFTDLYTQLVEELTNYVAGRPAKECSEKEIEKAYRRVDTTRFEDSSSWLVHLTVNECLRIRSYIFQWRDEHLHMPRNNLGGEFTKSLTGSPDAISAVKHMRDAARAKDPMLPVIRARGLGNEYGITAMGQLTKYLESESSLDREILAATGLITQHRFNDVQERLGFFANRCPFSPPPRRKV